MTEDEMIEVFGTLTRMGYKVQSHLNEEDGDYTVEAASRDPQEPINVNVVASFASSKGHTALVNTVWFK